MSLSPVQSRRSETMIPPLTREETIQRLHAYLKKPGASIMEPLFQALIETGKLEETCLNGTKHGEEIDKASQVCRGDFWTQCPKAPGSVFWYLSRTNHLYVFLKLKTDHGSCSLLLDKASGNSCFNHEFEDPFLESQNPSEIRPLLECGNLINLDSFKTLLNGGEVTSYITYRILSTQSYWQITHKKLSFSLASK